MPYHIRLSLKSDSDRDEVKLDLSEEQLEERYLKPYRLGVSIITDGRTIPIDDLERVRISYTEQPSAQIIRAIDARDMRSGVFTSLPMDWRVADYGTDVTDDFITSPPGQRTEPNIELTREGIFFAGQYYDALRALSGILPQAKNDIIIIDGYIDESILDLLTSKGSNVEVKILTKSVSPNLKVHIDAFVQQYGLLLVRTSQVFHDRFIIIDDTDFYHIGASIKDAAKRVFMFSRIEEPIMVDRLRQAWNSEWANASPI